jgi:hypothetical protein
MLSNVHQIKEKLTFVLTLALSGTGRDNQDLQRAKLLLETFDRFFNKESLEQFIIVTPAKDLSLVRTTIASHVDALKIKIIDENEICPEFRNNPDTTDTWPKPNQGWFKQQLIKLAIFEYVKTQFYMTLDSDVIFTRDFDSSSLIHKGKAALSVQKEGDFVDLYCPKTAAHEVLVRQNRYKKVEPILRHKRKKQYLDQWYGETPVLLNRQIVKLLVDHIESTWGKAWRQTLLEKLPWTEYPLYFVFAECEGILERYYEPGNADSVLMLNKSLWVPAHEYREHRDLSSWNPELVFGDQGQGIAVAVQSYLGYSVEKIVAKVRPFIQSKQPVQKISVSVIVPVYNVEKYIIQCLDSLLRQDLTSLEIIVVNDGSTDKTPGIVEKYARDHDSIQLINQQNMGLSAARNAGMDMAKGEYLGFVDGDDWVHESMYGSMLDKALTSGADVVITNGQLYNEETSKFSPIQDFHTWEALKKKNTDLVFSPRAEADLFMLDTSACKRLYKKSFLQSLGFQFPPGKIFEDVPTHYKLLLNTESVALLDQPYYLYRTNRPGRITAKNDESLFQVFDVMDRS